MEQLFNLVNGVKVPLTQEELTGVEAERLAAAEREAQAVALAREEYMQEFRDMRRELLNILTGIAIAEGLLEEFKVLRQLLLDIPQAEEVVSATTADEAKAAIKTEYAKAVSLAPQEFITAFKELGQ